MTEGAILIDTENQIPVEGKLSVLTEDAYTGVREKLRYGGQSHLRNCYRIPINLLHFNIANGRYRTKFLLLKKANPDANIDPTQDPWREEIFSLLNGTWEDATTGFGTRKERKYFLNLAEDIKDREQERPGIVLEDGGVMSGNRRLAALIHLYNKDQNEKFRFFEAFIIPQEGNVTDADKWHLEMSAQHAQARLTRNYDAVEKLLKIGEGVKLYKARHQNNDQKSAIKAVANDIGDTEDSISDELNTLNEIENYLDAIGHPEEWWLAEGLTEVFTEIDPLRKAFETSAMPLENRSKLIRTIHHLAKNDKIDYNFVRDIRKTVGPMVRRRDSKKMPTVTRILIENAPTTAVLRQEKSKATSSNSQHLVDKFKSEFEANKEQEEPLTKTERAASNLRKLVEILETQGMDNTQKIKKVVLSLEDSESLIDRALKILGKRK